MRRFLAPLFLALSVLSACAFGAAEFATYRQAFELQYVEGQKVLDEVGRAERTLVDQQFSRKPGIRAFDPDEAKYYVRVGDPPLTGAIRASLTALKDYNDALSGLATGEAAAAVRGELSSANTTLKSALTSLGGATGVDVNFVSTLSGGIAKAITVLEVLERAQNRIDFRQQLVAAHPDMKSLLTTLRAGTPEMFDVVQLSRTTVGGLGGTDGVSGDNLTRLQEFRTLMAGWVILLDQSALALDQAVVAVATQAGNPDLTSLIDASVELEILAGALKAARN
ncbi:hypothetical protein [uncultured Tateyamaria sp.]|uniref:hypothetical protein n=1 Tax=uncultured Tateyamaria sp. TaxID=455651 RepID=UPI002607539D|nr:hypothetical protein [uncultured Tateyamaria sp.]